MLLSQVLICVLCRMWWSLELAKSMIVVLWMCWRWVIITTRMQCSVAFCSQYIHTYMIHTYILSSWIQYIHNTIRFNKEIWKSIQVNHGIKWLNEINHRITWSTCMMWRYTKRKRYDMIRDDTIRYDTRPAVRNKTWQDKNKQSDFFDQYFIIMLCTIQHRTVRTDVTWHDSIRL